MSAFRHELGNTVNSLQLTLEVLLHRYPDFSDEKRLEFIHRAMGQVDRQHRLLIQMKEFSHIHVDTILPIPPAVFWDDVFRLIRSRLKETSISVGFVSDKSPHLFPKIAKQPSPPATRIPMMHIDPRAALHALSRILDNAVDALQEITEPLLHVTAALEESRMVIRIQDNGNGIRPEIHPNIFLPFVTSRFNHAGFGLSIAKKLMIQMGGDISVDTVLSGGTTVTLEFPLTWTSNAR